MDNYSFVNVPFTDAEHIVHSLGHQNGRPMAEITKDKESKGGERKGGSRRTKERGDESWGRDSSGEWKVPGMKGTKGSKPTKRKESPVRVSRKSEIKGSVEPKERPASVMSNEGFDWSIFATGERWGDKPAKGKKGRK